MPAPHPSLRHIRGLREQGVRTFFSVGVAITEPIRTAIQACVDWMPGIEADRELRDGAEIAEITHLVDLSAYPPGTRMIVRRERPHPAHSSASSTPSNLVENRPLLPTRPVLTVWVAKSGMSCGDAGLASGV